MTYNCKFLQGVAKDRYFDIYIFLYLMRKLLISSRVIIKWERLETDNELNNLLITLKYTMKNQIPEKKGKKWEQIPPFINIQGIVAHTW